MPFLKLFDILPGWIYAAIIAALLVAGAVALTTERGALLLEQKQHAETKEAAAKFAKAVSDRETERANTAVAAADANRELERNRSKAAQESMNELLNETSATAAERARADERGRVRDQLIDAAASRAAGGQGGSDPTALRRAEEAASTLGGLLKACRAEGRSDGAEFEGLASQLRSVIAQYESLLTKGTSP